MEPEVSGADGWEVKMNIKWKKEEQTISEHERNPEERLETMLVSHCLSFNFDGGWHSIS